MSIVKDYLATLPEVNTSFEMIYQENNPNNMPYMQVLGYIWDDKIFSDKDSLVEHIESKNTLENIDELDFITVIHKWEKYLSLAEELRAGNKFQDYHWWKINSEYLNEL